MCACLTDFAAPKILKVEADLEAKDNTRKTMTDPIVLGSDHCVVWSRD